MTKQTIQSNRETINKIDAPLGVGLIRVLAFLSKSPGEEFIQATIQKNVGMEAWDRLKEYLFELCDKELVHMENKTDTIGHKVYKITSLGMEAFETPAVNMFHPLTPVW
jgi:predicted transcriptional regulator